MKYTISFTLDASNVTQAKQTILDSIPSVAPDSIQIRGRIDPYDAGDDPTEQALKQRMARMCNAHKR